MGLLDIILALLLAYGLYKGFRNGLLIEIASIVALIAGIYGAIHLSYVAADYLSERVSWEMLYIKLAAFTITFLAIVILVHLFGKFLTGIADLAMLGIVNTLAGAVFGLVKMAVILGALLIFYERANGAWQFIDPRTKKESILYQPLKDVGAFVFNLVLEPPAANDAPGIDL